MKSKRIRVNMQEHRLKRLDLMCKMFAMDRSSFIKMLLDDKFIQLVDNEIITQEKANELLQVE
jgi:metal-responsive CopG/Arc/MetJ family transcriptional regulator